MESNDEINNVFDVLELNCDSKKNYFETLKEKNFDSNKSTSR